MWVGQDDLWLLNTVELLQTSASHLFVVMTDKDDFTFHAEIPDPANHCKSSNKLNKTL